MKVRATIAGTALSVRLTAIGWAALTVLASVLISGCSGSSTSTPPVVFSPTVSGSAGVSVSASGTAGGGVGASSSARADTPSATATISDSPTATPAQTLTPNPTPTPTQSASPFPTAAPVTGGGGTAGFQDGLLLVLGLAAIVAGAGSIAYRRRITRNR